MTENKKVLGKGFSALIGDSLDKDLVLGDNEQIVQIKLSDISPAPNQPRKSFEQKSLHELADSIIQFGVLQPIIVTKDEFNNNKYYIIAGERRWRASKLAGLDKVPSVVRDLEQIERMEVALIENVQRVDLNPIEQAQGISQLLHNFSITISDVAKKLGKDSTTVNNTYKLLQLPENVKEALIDRKISEGHARLFHSLDEANRKYLLNQIITNGWSVRQAERFAKSVRTGVKETSTASLRSQTTTPQTIKLSEKLGLKVEIRRTAKGGKLELNFKNEEELEKIIQSLSDLNKLI